MENDELNSEKTEEIVEKFSNNLIEISENGKILK